MATTEPPSLPNANGQQRELLTRMNTIIDFATTPEFRQLDAFQLHERLNRFRSRFTTLETATATAKDAAADEVARNALDAEFYRFEDRYLDACATFERRIQELNAPTVEHMTENSNNRVALSENSGLAHSSLPDADGPAQRRRIYNVVPARYLHDPLNGEQTVYPCPVCGLVGVHKAQDCPKFKPLTYYERMTAARINKMCVNCLKRGHYKAQCWDPKRCQLPQCARDNRHNSMLCPFKAPHKRLTTQELAKLGHTKHRRTEMNESHENRKPLESKSDRKRKNKKRKCRNGKGKCNEAPVERKPKIETLST